MDGDVFAIVVAAGEGRRFGGPKQFEQLAGRTVVEWSVDAARAVVDGVVLVVPGSRRDDASAHAGCANVTEGGATRSDSVRAGLSMVPDQARIIVVHDAARPLASAALFRAVIAAVNEGADGAIPVLPVTETLKRVEEGRVVSTVERDSLVVVQTPQAFRADILRRAHETSGEATDDAALVEAIGGDVVVVAGEWQNRKLTDQEDAALFEWYLSGHRANVATSR